MTLSILMVDDEAEIVRKAARRIARLRPGTAFEGFTDPLRALARLRESAPEILLIGAEMPAMSGLKLLSAARSVVSDIPAILLAKAPTPELLTTLEAYANIEVLEKPCSIEALFAAIDRAAARRAIPKMGFSGRLRLPMLPDLIQTLALTGASVSLEIRAKAEPDGTGSDLGRIWFHKGEIVHARHGERSGPNAFYSLLALQAGQFSTEPCPLPPERTIAARWEELLMDGLRRLDESSQGTSPEEQPPAPGACFSADEMRLMRQSIRAGEKGLVVAAYRPSLESIALVADGRDVQLDAWKVALIGMTGALRRLSSELEGLFEDVHEDAAIAISWSWPGDRVVLLAQALEGVSSISRFRLRVAAFHRAVCASVQAALPAGLTGKIGTE